MRELLAPLLDLLLQRPPVAVPLLLGIRHLPPKALLLLLGLLRLQIVHLGAVGLPLQLGLLVVLLSHPLEPLLGAGFHCPHLRVQLVGVLSEDRVLHVAEAVARQEELLARGYDGLLELADLHELRGLRLRAHVHPEPPLVGPAPHIQPPVAGAVLDGHPLPARVRLRRGLGPVRGQRSSEGGLPVRRARVLGSIRIRGPPIEHCSLVDHVNDSFHWACGRVMRPAALSHLVFRCLCRAHGLLQRIYAHRRVIRLHWGSPRGSLHRGTR
mmetsp:Transcript_7746/g.25958  ORF Transcript_7746/g.25958 Transcript_7746/m.25958 type:complete len:269 (+) Transcript_7746:1357-2163(+)